MSAPEATDPVAQVQAAVKALEDALPALLEGCTDPQGLDMAQLLWEVQQARTTLQSLERDTEAATAKALLSDMVQAGEWRVERQRSRDRKAWDHDTWRRDVRQQALRKAGLLGVQGLVNADGEVVDAKGVLGGLLAEVQEVAGSHPPKVTGLRGLGLDPADYCETHPGATKVRVQRIAVEDQPEEGGNDAA